MEGNVPVKMVQLVLRCLAKLSVAKLGWWWCLCALQAAS